MQSWRSRYCWIHGSGGPRKMLSFTIDIDHFYRHFPEILAHQISDERSQLNISIIDYFLLEKTVDWDFDWRKQGESFERIWTWMWIKVFLHFLAFLARQASNAISKISDSILKQDGLLPLFSFPISVKMPFRKIKAFF